MLPISDFPSVINPDTESPFFEGNTMAVICGQQKMALNATQIKHNFFCVKEIYDANVDLEDKIQNHELIAIYTENRRIRCIFVSSGLNTSEIERIMLISCKGFLGTVLPKVDFIVSDEQNYSLMANKARSTKDSTLTPVFTQKILDAVESSSKESKRACSCNIL